MSRKIIVLLFLLIPSLAMAEHHSFESLPVQDAGRIKPLMTVAQETLQLIHGKSKYEKKPALDILTTWILVPKPWMEKEIIKMDHHGLKKALGFPKDKKYFTPGEVGTHQRLNVLFSDLQVRTARKEKLNAYYQAIQRLEGQLLTFYGVTQGGIKIFPPGKDEESTNWKTLREMNETQSEAFFKVLAAYSSQFTSEDKVAIAKGKADLDVALQGFTQLAVEHGGDKYPAVEDMWTEVHYQKLKPFFWTWILYLLATLVFTFSFL